MNSKDMIITYIRFGLVLPVFLLMAGIFILVGFIHLPALYPIVSPFCRLILFLLGIKVKVVGEFPSEGTFVVMANHASFVDIFLLPLVTTGKYTGVVAQYNYRYPIWKQVLIMFKAIPIQRKNIQHAIRGINRAEDVLRAGYHVMIMPEGTRTLTGKMNPLKKGGFHMAINTSTPILPIGFDGAYSYKPKNRKTVKPGPVTIRIGVPIPAKEYPNLGMDGLMKCVDEQLHRLSGES